MMQYLNDGLVALKIIYEHKQSS